ncbi:MAG: NAD(P)H-hydrate epimerase, partial [Planctomycetaceae bacterium]|nr:NAD(P)H-hydrate epimerase [Planctomycetaceae bacterium]
MIPQVMSREQVRDVDRRAVDEFKMPSLLLMENAGRGAAEVLMSAGIAGPVLVCAGKGNNGGDGFVIARHLENHGHEVHVLLFSDPEQLQGDAEINYRILEAAKTPVEVWVKEFPTEQLTEKLTDRLRSADWIVDALLGTGMRGEVRAPFDAIIRAINQSSARVLAVDLPSGMDCDTGDPLGVCIQAELTATFVARKKGFENPETS